MIVVPRDGKVLLYGPAMANVVSEPILKKEYDILPQLREYMVSVMRSSRSRGLSAPQVGVFKQFLIFERSDGEIIDMVNPEITQMYGRELPSMEACLSLPPDGNGCLVPRMQTIGVEFESSAMPGLAQEVILDGPDAVVAQHEIDHLTGTFFFERASNVAKRHVLERYKKWKEERNVYVIEGNSRPLTAHRV